MLSCKEVLARHSEFIDGAMPQVDAERWHAHLAACALCARYDRVLRKGVGLLRDHTAVQPDPEFMLHLRYRLAHEEERMAMGPITAGAATSVTVAAVLALAVWVPFALVSRASESRSTVTSTELGRTAAEIAWHGGRAIDKHESHATLSAPDVILNHTHATISLIDRGYTPLILEPPTAPPSYSRVTLTSLGTR